MRATGYALDLPLLIIAVLDFPLFLGAMDPYVYLGIITVVRVVFLVRAGLALAQTHGTSHLRGLAVALLPALIVFEMATARAVLVSEIVPGLEPPSSDTFYIP
jgi:hypothetical protein